MKAYFSKAAEEEIRSVAHSESVKQDLERIAGSRKNPFLRAENADVDAFIKFVADFNEFINHQPKPFEPMQDTDMRL